MRCSAACWASPGPRCRGTTPPSPPRSPSCSTARTSMWPTSTSPPTRSPAPSSPRSRWTATAPLGGRTTSWHGSATRSAGASEMRVAVTGASGYIGQEVASELRRQGYRVAPLTRGDVPGQYRDMLLGEVGTLAEHIASCRHVIHLAGQLVRDRSAGILDYFAANVELTYEVMAAAADAGLESVVHASSRLVYPVTLREP